MMEYVQHLAILYVVGLSWARTTSPNDILDATESAGAMSTELPLHLQEEEFKYLEQNGFLSTEVTMHDPPDVLEHQVENAILKFQKFYRIPKSGHMDNTTRSTMWKPRCGFPDILKVDEDDEGGVISGTMNHRRKRFNAPGGFYKWSTYKLTYAIMNYPRRGNHKAWEVRTVIKRAFEVWSEVTPLTFKETKPEEADIRIGFYSGRHSLDKDHPVFDGPDGDLAHAFSPNAGWGKVDGDVHFDNDEVFTMETGNNAGYSFFQIAAHEIGHALGLDHSDDPSALMWPHYHYIHNFKLPKDDYLGIQHLYGKNPNNKQGPSSFHLQTPCTKSFDAIVSIEGIMYIFKGTRYWEVWSGRLLSGEEGKSIRDHWYKLPSRINAVYQRKDGKTLFFKGTKYWVYHGQYPLAGYPKPVKDLGLPNAIDAAVPIGGRKTFFFKKKMVYRYDERTRTIDPGFPRTIRQVFKDLPNRIRIGFTHNDGNSYFIKGIKYYRMTTRLKTVDTGYPKEFAVDFMGCPSRASLATNQVLNLEANDDDDDETYEDHENIDEEMV